MDLQTYGYTDKQTYGHTEVRTYIYLFTHTQSTFVTVKPRGHRRELQTAAPKAWPWHPHHQRGTRLRGRVPALTSPRPRSFQGGSVLLRLAILYRAQVFDMSL